MLWFVGLGISGISELSDNTISVIKMPILFIWNHLPVQFQKLKKNN